MSCGIGPHVIHRCAAGSRQRQETVVAKQRIEIEDGLKLVILNVDGHSHGIAAATGGIGPLGIHHDVVSS